MRNVAVFFGGRSCENEISVLTGVFVLNLLDREKYVPLPVYIHTDGTMYTSKKMTDLDVFRKNKYENFQKIFFDGATVYEMKEKKGKIKRLLNVDVALNCCHGGLGEGGGVSAMMEWCGVPFASPDLTGSGVFMDKGMTKLVMRALNIPTLEYIRVNERDYEKRGAFLLKTIDARLKYPVVIKPAHLGSSIGIAVAKNDLEAKRAIEDAFALDNRVIIERYLEEKQDVNCAAYILNGEICVSEPEAAFGNGLYTFEEKYIKRQSDGGVLAGGKMQNEGGRALLSGELREKIRSYTKTIYKRMNLQGVVRMDYLISEGKAYLCEVNTVPGSLAYYLFCERIVDARRFFSDLIEEAMSSAEKGKRVLATGILKSVSWNRK